MQQFGSDRGESGHRADIVDRSKMTRRRLSWPPIIALQEQQHSCSFDHLVGGSEQGLRHGEAERLGGLEVDDQLELGRFLHRKIGRVRALDNAVHVIGGPAEYVRRIRPVHHEPAFDRELPVARDGRQPVFSGSCAI